MDSITTTSIGSILRDLFINFNTLLDCPARFSGEFNEQKIQYFLEYIDFYKRTKCIKDGQALQELQYLLIDHAHNWWMRRKENVETWSEALTILQNQYSKKRPANKVYEEILKHHYDDYQCKCDFIDDKMELFTELPQTELNERNKLDFIYALLPREVQNKINLENITNVKDLKKYLKLIASVTEIGPSAKETALLNSRTTSCLRIVLTESASIKPSGQEINNQISGETETRGDFGREPVIKVRRTEDLMPSEVKEETNSPDNIVSNESKSSDTCNTLLSSHENFQIDSDIMNQINNIINETELSMDAINNDEDASAATSQTSNAVMSLEFLGFQIDESSSNKSKSLLKFSRKTKKRCSYCRHFNHTSPECLKRAKHMKLFPERFVQNSTSENNDSLIEANFEALSGALPINVKTNSLSLPNTQTTEIFSATSNITNTSSNMTTSADTSNPFANSAVILNNVTERHISSILTTKLIPAINGKATNKVVSSKLRNTNSISPKCHQCGTVGFYKSICPNCSPIYNNNSHK